jgi:hypothetical protein
MGCLHKKEGRHDLWCRPCAEKKAGRKPKLEWQHGDIASDREGDRYKVLDSELTLYGIATEAPEWGEDLVLKGPGRQLGHGTASLYTRVSRRKKANVARASEKRNG